MSEIPKTPADCLCGITMAPLLRDRIISRIEILVQQRVQDAVLTAVGECHAAAMNALVAPITAAEIDKANG